MTKIRTLIIDDEVLARRRIMRLLQTDEEVEIVGECKNGKEALDAFNAEACDLALLDIQMPDLNGFEVLKACSSKKLPLVIFITAFDKYAIEAFKAHAVNYLLKPFDDEVFDLAIRQAKELLRWKKRTS